MKAGTTLALCEDLEHARFAVCGDVSAWAMVSAGENCAPMRTVCGLLGSTSGHDCDY